MKKDRDVVTPYPIYQPYQSINPMPYMPGMMPNMVTPSFMSSGCSNNSDISSLEQRVSNLEKRVSTLENMMNTTNTINNNYNSTNYQML